MAWSTPTLSQLASRLGSRPADVLILDLTWISGEGAVESLSSSISRRPGLAVIGLAAYHDIHSSEIDLALAARLCDKVLLKVATSEQLVGAVRDVFRKKRNLEDPELAQARAALDRIARRPPGDQWKEHEADVATVLRYLFSPVLGKQYLQPRTRDGTERRDIVMVNEAEAGFFARMRAKHGADYVVFEVKNVTETKPEHLDQAANYCWPLLGRLGVVVARTHPGEAWGRHAALQWYHHNAVVLLLCDDDLREMVEAKASGADPVQLIQEQYDRFILSL